MTTHQQSVFAILDKRLGDDADLGPDVRICTSQAAQLLGIKPPSVARYCDFGILKEGRDWIRYGDRGNYRISRRSVMKLKLGIL